VKHFTVCLIVLLASAVVVGFSSAPAYAVDGVVLINQNTSITGLPGCPHSGFPIIICQSGSYRLSGDLTITGVTDGVDINADNVTFDLNGFSITGPVTCDGGSIRRTTSCSGTGGIGVIAGGNLSANNITIRNGTVRGMRIGVATLSSGVLIEEIHAFKNSVQGINVFHAVVRRNTSTNNGGSGIETQASVVVNNIVSLNQGFGVIGDFGDTIIQNTVYGNGMDGINAISALVTDNSSTGNGGKNLNLSGSVSSNNNCAGPC
jgi:hypothetical protein